MSTAIYAWLLTFYPEELRREYGEEMTLVFADDLRSRGPLRVWWNVLVEFLRFGLPHTFSRGALRVLALGLAFSLVTLSAELLTHCIGHLPPRYAFAATLISLAPALLPCVVICACRGGTVISLNLKDH